MSLVESRLGLPPWDVLHQGIARHSPLSFGEAVIAVGVLVLAAAILLGARIGIGTVANAILIGTFIDLLLAIDRVQDLAHESLAGRTGLLALGIVLTGVGSAFYIGAGLGAGPRDSLMIALWQKTGIRVGAVRAAIELSALSAGIFLGGTFGIGTVAFALLIGPCIEASFALFRRSALGKRDRSGSNEPHRANATPYHGDMSVDRLRTLLGEAFPNAQQLSVDDRTGGGDHFRVVVASPRFDGLSLVEQHRLVYDALADPLRDGTIHELRIQTKGSA